MRTMIRAHLPFHMDTHHARPQGQQGQAQQAGYLCTGQAQLGGELQALSVGHHGLDQQALATVQLGQPLVEGETERQ